MKMNIGIEKGGLPFIGGGSLLFLIVGGWYFLSGGLYLFVPALLSLLFILFMIFFFRDPHRKTEGREGEIVSPADGRIVEIEEVFEKEFLMERGRRISIFLHLLDPHINRSPVDGRVSWIRYRKGRFHPAMKRIASEENEHNSIGILSRSNKILVRQIAGRIARRIVSYVKEGQTLNQGEKIGMIRFGSRVELFLPIHVSLQVKKGDRVKAGVTIIGRMNEVSQ